MAVVVLLSAVVTQEAHRVTLRDVLRVILHELLGRVPKSRNGFQVLVQTQDEAVLLLVVGHVLERVIVDIAEQLNARLNSPVPLVVQHRLLAEEEPRFKSAHVTIADRVSVDNLFLRHFLTNLLRLLLVNVVWERPVLLGYLRIVGGARDEGGRHLLELLVKGLIVEEDPIIMVLAVEPILDLPNRAGDFPQVRVSRQRNKGSVHSLASCSGGGKARARIWGRWRGLLGVFRIGIVWLLPNIW